MQIKKAALIGMGAIGTVYGKLLHDRYGADFAVIAGGARKEKLKGNGIRLNGSVFYPRVLSPGEQNFPADLIIVSVKNDQLSKALEDMRSFVGESTVILPLLNGVTVRDRILSVFPDNRVFYGLSIYIDAVRTADGVQNTVDGVIDFGDADNTVPSPEVTAVKAFLAAAGIECEAPSDMIRTVWKKWMLNVGCNQVSAITGAPYGKMTGIETNGILFHEAMMEVVALAKAHHIDLTEQDALEYENLMSTFSPLGKTSMLQDIEAKRRTEVDYFAGTVVELGRKYQVSTPVNHVLYCIIKSMEQLY